MFVEVIGIKKKSTKQNYFWGKGERPSHTLQVKFKQETKPTNSLRVLEADFYFGI
jgi:hypothetical protein